MAAAVDVSPSFGAELKDGFKPVNAWVANGISWLEDLSMFYRDRSLIEKDYSAKLAALAKKYFDKKLKRSSTLSVGDTPTVTPGSLESASLTTWTTQLTTLEKRAEEHDQFANLLVSSLAEPIRRLANRSEDLRKEHADFAAKLEKEKEASFGDLKKAKGKYDSVCHEVESRRKKAEGGFDKAKAQNAYQVQLAEMRNAKNSYLISINVTNKQREKYYHDYVPELLDSLQALSETRTSSLNSLWLTASSIESHMLTNSNTLLEHQKSEIPRNNPVLDSMMFARHNTPQWSDPPDFVFEPSPVWLDDSNMAIDAGSKTFLMNILTKSKGGIGDLKRVRDSSKAEVEGAKRIRIAIREGKDKRNEVDIVRGQFQNQEVLHEADRRLTTAEVEIATITGVVGDISRGARNHVFHPQTFKIPTNCDFCADRIWGLSAKGMSCEECGFTCHTKCELKVAPDCPGQLNKEEKKSLKAERQAAAQATAAAPVEVVAPVTTNGGGNAGQMPGLSRSDTLSSMNTLSSGYAASAQRSVSGTMARPTSAAPEDPFSSSAAVTAPIASAPAAAVGGRRRIAAPPPSQYLTAGTNGDDAPSNQQKGKMLYPYTATNAGEISVSEAQSFTLVEPDDGSGWIKIKPDSFGATAGLVPATYAEINPSSEPDGAASTATRLSQILVERERPISTASANSNSDTGSSMTTQSRTKKQGPAVAPRRGAKKLPTQAQKHVEALYTYSASGAGEVDMVEGERMILIAPDGGDGWCEVQREEGEKGIVPAGWVKEV